MLRKDLVSENDTRRLTRQGQGSPREDKSRCSGWVAGSYETSSMIQDPRAKGKPTVTGS